MESPDQPELVPEQSVPKTFAVGGASDSPLVASDGANQELLIKPSDGRSSTEFAEEPQNDDGGNGVEYESSSVVEGGYSAMWPEYCNPSYQMPGKIEVKVSVGGETYFFPVTIVKAEPEAKRYFGGYRNKLNGKIYHHANSQTPTDRKTSSKDYSNLRSRETQTYEVRSLSIQAYRESGTQMERIDLRLDNKRDRVKHAKKYFTSDQLMIKKKAKVLVIQRCWRGYMARCLAESIRQKNIAYTEAQEQLRIDEEEKDRQKRLEDMTRRTHPKTNSDFAVLYSELDTWRKAEIAKIKATAKDPEEKKSAMAALLANEVKALQSMQKLKLSAQKELHVERTEKMLEMMAKPQQWQLSRGEIAQVQTPETQRAKELLDLFNALNAPLTAVDQRLDILLNVKVRFATIDWMWLSSCNLFIFKC